MSNTTIAVKSTAFLRNSFGNRFFVGKRSEGFEEDKNLGEVRTKKKSWIGSWARRERFIVYSNEGVNK